MVSGVVSRNRVLGGRAHRYHMANTVERSCAAATSGSAIRGGHAACSRITLGNLVIFEVRLYTSVTEAGLKFKFSEICRVYSARISTVGAFHDDEPISDKT